MVQCARFSYVRNTDRWFQVPDSSGNKVTFPFDLPGLDPIQPVVLMFKVEMHGTADFRMYVNNHSFVIDFQTNPSKKTDSPRSWHEVIQHDQGLKASQNVLSILTEWTGAVIKLSDIVFLYHANANQFNELVHCWRWSVAEFGFAWCSHVAIGRQGGVLLVGEQSVQLTSQNPLLILIKHVSVGPFASRA